MKVLFTLSCFLLTSTAFAAELGRPSRAPNPPAQDSIIAEQAAEIERLKALIASREKTLDDQCLALFNHAIELSENVGYYQDQESPCPGWYGAPYLVAQNEAVFEAFRQAEACQEHQGQLPR
jgi:hypothetical protein